MGSSCFLGSENSLPQSGSQNTLHGGSILIYGTVGLIIEQYCTCLTPLSYKSPIYYLLLTVSATHDTMNKLTIRRGTSTNKSTIEAQTMNQARRRTRSSSVLSLGSVVVVVLVGISVGNWLPAVNCWSLPSRTTKSLDSSFISSSLSPSSVDDSSQPLLKVSNHLPSSPSSTSTSRRSVLSTVVTASAWSFLSLSLIVAPKNVYAAMDDDNSSLFIRKLKVLSDKELTYQIAIPSSMKESSKPIKTHLDEVNFMSESTRGYQYGITVDPVRITSIKEVRYDCTMFVYDVI